MKSLFTFLMVVGALVVGVRNASAQIDTEIEFTATFPFTVGNATLPAGAYSISADDLDPMMLLVRGSRASVFLPTIEATPTGTPAQNQVVFARYGRGYALKNIWIAGSTVGYEADINLAEKHLARANETPTEHRVAAHAKAKRVTANRAAAPK